jgi:hypothetical protein
MSNSSKPAMVLTADEGAARDPPDAIVEFLFCIFVLYTILHQKNTSSF